MNPDLHLSTAAVPTFVASMANRTASASLSRATRIASVLFITALTAAAAQISIPLPFTPVPLTFQPMVVLLGGLALGARLGLASQVLYLSIGLAGLPVFAASTVLPPGIGRLLGPTGGYLMAYPLAAFVAGWLAERGFDRRYATSVLAMAAGLAVVFTSGVLWLAFFTRAAHGAADGVGLSLALQAGLYPFVAMDAVKLLVAAAIAPAMWRLAGYFPSTSKY